VVRRGETTKKRELGSFKGGLGGTLQEEMKRGGSAALGSAGKRRVQQRFLTQLLYHAPESTGAGTVCGTLQGKEKLKGEARDSPKSPEERGKSFLTSGMGKDGRPQEDRKCRRLASKRKIGEKEGEKSLRGARRELTDYLRKGKRIEGW